MRTWFAWLSAPLLLVSCGPTAEVPSAAAPPPPPASASSPMAASASPPPAVVRSTAMRPVPLAELPPLWDAAGAAEGWDNLVLALERNRRWLRNRPSDQVFEFGPRQLPAKTLLAGVERLLRFLAENPTAEQLAARVARHFEVYESVGKGQGDMLITGYYEPVIEGSRRRSANYPVPVYGPPGNLIRVDLGAFSSDFKGKRIAGVLEGGRLVPFADRGEIRRKPLRGREIAWAKDAVDLFFIEVQGSGAMSLPGGGEMRIRYAGRNGRPYRSIGKMLITEGKVPRERMSMQAIRQYLSEHPEEVERVLDYNPSVVFFRELNGPPVGSLGVPVTPGRSIATDHRLFPKGAIGFLISDQPRMGQDGTTVVEAPLTRFVVNQDTGGAIRGADRADFFWGRGADAAERAGVMKQPGRLLFLLPKRGG